MSDEDENPVLSGSVNEVGVALHKKSHKSVYAYVRVSSRQQDVEGESLEMQAKDIRTYCREHGLDQPIIVSDVASCKNPMFALPSVAGMQKQQDTSSRPILLLLLGHITGLERCHLVVWKLDRLSRHSGEQEIISQLLDRHKGELHSCQPGEDDILKRGVQDPMANLMRTVFTAFAQYERAMIEMRMAAGLRNKAARGGYTGGKKPFGYGIVNNDLTVDPFEAQVVKYIFYLRYELGISLRNLAGQLTSETGKKWSHTRVDRILKTEQLYRGYYTDRFKQVHYRQDLIILDQEDNDYSHIFTTESETKDEQS